MANGFLNTSLGSRERDSSYLGQIAYTGDYFLRIPEKKRKWIAHVDEDDTIVAGGGDGEEKAGGAGGEKRVYLAVHGHSLNGTKFFSWGQSGPGRLAPDFRAILGLF